MKPMLPSAFFSARFVRLQADLLPVGGHSYKTIQIELIQSLLPIAIIVATLLSPVNGNQKIPIGVIATTALATLFSVHCALSFQFPSIELLLCIFESIFLSKAMLFFERVAEDAIPATYQKIEEGSLSPPEDPSIRFLFLVPLRNISLLLTISLTICTISLSIITPSIGLPAGSLHDEFVGAFQELVRWSLICSLVASVPMSFLILVVATTSNVVSHRQDAGSLKPACTALSMSNTTFTRPRIMPRNFPPTLIYGQSLMDTRKDAARHVGRNIPLRCHSTHPTWPSTRIVAA